MGGPGMKGGASGGYVMKGGYSYSSSSATTKGGSKGGTKKGGKKKADTPDPQPEPEPEPEPLESRPVKEEPALTPPVLEEPEPEPRAPPTLEEPVFNEPQPAKPKPKPRVKPPPPRDTPEEYAAPVVPAYVAPAYEEYEPPQEAPPSASSEAREEPLPRVLLKVEGEPMPFFAKAPHYHHPVPASGERRRERDGAQPSDFRATPPPREAPGKQYADSLPSEHIQLTLKGDDHDANSTMPCVGPTPSLRPSSRRPSSSLRPSRVPSLGPRQQSVTVVREPTVGELCAPQSIDRTSSVSPGRLQRGSSLRRGSSRGAPRNRGQRFIVKEISADSVESMIARQYSDTYSQDSLGDMPRTTSRIKTHISTFSQQQQQHNPPQPQPTPDTLPTHYSTAGVPVMAQPSDLNLGPGPYDSAGDVSSGLSLAPTNAVGGVSTFRTAAAAPEPLVSRMPVAQLVQYYTPQPVEQYAPHDCDCTVLAAQAQALQQRVDALDSRTMHLQIQAPAAPAEQEKRRKPRIKKRNVATSTPTKRRSPKRAEAWSDSSEPRCTPTPMPARHVAHRDGEVRRSESPRHCHRCGGAYCDACGSPLRVDRYVASVEDPPSQWVGFQRHGHALPAPGAHVPVFREQQRTSPQGYRHPLLRHTPRPADPFGALEPYRQSDVGRARERR